MLAAAWAWRHGCDAWQKETARGGGGALPLCRARARARGGGGGGRAGARSDRAILLGGLPGRWRGRGCGARGARAPSCARRRWAASIWRHRRGDGEGAARQSGGGTRGQSAALRRRTLGTLGTRAREGRRRRTRAGGPADAPATCACVGLRRVPRGRAGGALQCRSGGGRRGGALWRRCGRWRCGGGQGGGREPRLREGRGCR